MPPLVGSTRPSSQPLAAPSPRLDPNAFGAGVAVALGNLAGSMDQFAESQLDIQDAKDELALAEREKRRKTNNFKMLRGLSELGVAAKQHAQQLSTSVGPDADGYTNLVREEVEKLRQDWLKTVDPELLEEADYRSGLLLDDLTTGAYKHEYTSGREFTTQQIAISQNQALTNIYDDPESANEERIRVLEEINAAPYLTALEKETLATQFDAAAAAAEAGKRIEIYALSQGTVGEADGSDIVAAGLPVVARGLLNAIASVEAPGYDVLNGGARFDGYDDHPGRRGNKSTAAGRYQFIEGTWRRVAAEIDAPNFAPEWQDRGAWFLAREDYNRRTGKDLYAELMSGDRERIKAVRRVLAGKGDKDVTWQGLQHMSDDAFANYIMGSKGIRGGEPEGELTYPAGPALFDDPRYANIPFETKIALAEDAERRASAARTKQEKEEAEQYQSWLTQYEFDVDAGVKGRADFEADLELGKFKDLAHVERLRNIYDNRNKGVADAHYVATILSDPNGVIRRNDERAARGLNEMVKIDDGLGRIQNQDQEYITKAVVPLVQRAQDIPTDVIGALEAMARSNNPGQVAFAYESLRQIEAAAPDAFRLRMPDDAEKDYQLYMGMQGAFPEEERIRRVRNVREFRQENAALAEQAESLLKGEAFEKTLTRVVDNISTELFNDPDLPPIPRVQEQFKREFKALFVEAYSRTGDAAIAEQVATKGLQKSWAPFEFGNRWALMKHAPQTLGYQTVNNSYDWMTQQIEEEYPELREAEWYQLVPDRQTRNEKEQFSSNKRTKLPSYLLFRQDANGTIGAVLDENNREVRWRGDPTPFTERFIAETADENLLHRFQELDNKKLHRPREWTDADMEEWRRLHKEVEAMRKRQLEEVEANTPQIPIGTTLPLGARTDDAE